jgi:hypothetical protein
LNKLARRKPTGVMSRLDIGEELGLNPVALSFLMALVRVSKYFVTYGASSASMALPRSSFPNGFRNTDLARNGSGKPLVV